MKQSEAITATLGTGAAKITELSNDEKKRLPRLTLMLPAEIEVLNSGHSDAIVARHPAESFEIHGDRVRQLYDFLKSYYEP